MQGEGQVFNLENEKHQLEGGSYDHLKPCYWYLASELANELSFSRELPVHNISTIESSYERVVENN